MADIEYGTHVTAQRRVSFRDRDAGKLGQSCGRGARVEMVFEVVHDFVRRFEETIGLRFKGQSDGSVCAILQFNEMSGYAQYVFRERGNHLGTRHARFESERRTLY